MAVNGIELAIGQKWRMRGGESAIIESYVADQHLCWNLSNGVRVSDEGVFWASGQPCEGDLIEQVPAEIGVDLSAEGLDWMHFTHPAPKSPGVPESWRQALLNARPGEVIRVPSAAAVGDIHSTAKGSGARFNAGKPAFELVPLRLVAESYRRNSSAPEIQRCVEALFRLADFQGRVKDNLLSVAVLLGLDGWDDCARVLDYGQRKYVAWNWSKGMAWSIPIACAARHLLAMIRGEVNDPESELPHRGHVLANIVMLETYKHTFPEGDDRAPAGYLAPLLEAA